MAEASQISLESLFLIESYVDGRRVVIGLRCPQVVAYFFDSAGRLVGDELAKKATGPSTSAPKSDISLTP